LRMCGFAHSNAGRRHSGRAIRGGWPREQMHRGLGDHRGADERAHLDRWMTVRGKRSTNAVRQPRETGAV
jgi:hypothetical protein